MRSLVFDAQDRLHLPLTLFAKEVHARLAPRPFRSTCTRLPLLHLARYEYLAGSHGTNLGSATRRVRRSIDDYLAQKLQCQILPQRQGWKYVASTAGTKSTLRIFLAALKLYYQIMELTRKNGVSKGGE